MDRACTRLTIGTTSWRAGCGESRTSGSGGGPGKRTGRDDRHRAPGRPHWANERLTQQRARKARELRAAGRPEQAATLGKGMWALRKKPIDLTGGQKTALAQIAADNKQLYRGYLIKEQLREAFTVKGQDGKRLLRGVIAWARRCRIPEFVSLAKTLTKYRATIDNTLDHNVSNGRAEALNAQINALITRARGFRTAPALIAMIEFKHGGLCPDSPWT